MVDSMLPLIPLALAVTLIVSPAGACPLEAQGPFDADGRPHGEWHIVHCDGTEAAGRFRHGDRHGSWTVHYPDGRTGEGAFVSDRRDGRWTYRYPDGSRVFGAYRDGLLDGVWTMNDANGATVQRECWKKGRWMGEADLCAE